MIYRRWLDNCSNTVCPHDLQEMAAFFGIFRIPAAMPHYQTVPGLEYCGYRNLTQTIPFTSTEIPGLVGGHPLNSSTETGIHYPVMTSVSEQPCPYLPMPPSPPVFAGVAVSEVSIPIDYPLNLSMNSRSSHQGKTHADDDYDS